MMDAKDLIHIYQNLINNGFRVWLTGGWGIDALLGEQNRPHKDMDIILLLEDIERFCVLMSQQGYHLKELWEENRWVSQDQGNEIATAFVLQDDAGREIDVHAIKFDEEGNGIPAWEADEGFILRKEDLDAKGVIAGIPFRCISANLQLRYHTGYELPEYQQRDVERLRKAFGIA